MAVAENERLNLAKIVRAGDTVAWPQGTCEPRALVRELASARHEIGPLKVFVGASMADSLTSEMADMIEFRTTGGTVTNHRLGVHQQVVPTHVSTLPDLIRRGFAPVDVVFLKVREHPVTGEISVGPVIDYINEAMDSARVVVAEINDSTPFLRGDAVIDRDRIDFFIRSDEPLFEVSRSGEPTPQVEALAENVVEFIPDGAVLQLGWGAIPDAVMARLAQHSGLGIHSGMISDSVMELVRSGVIDNSTKPVDRGISVTGSVFGTQALYDWVDDNPAVEVRRTTYLHDLNVIRQFEHFISVNSAIEVDLTGQVNAEVIGDRYVGAIGGHNDYVRAAVRSPQGRSLIAMPSVIEGKGITRIVPTLRSGVVTTSRADVDVVVTEFGAAELRGKSLRERAIALRGIADPASHDLLDAHIAERDSKGWI